MKSFIILALILFTFLAPAAVVLKSVGQVGQRFITSRDVQISAVIESVNQQAKNEKIEVKVPEIKSATFQMELSRVLLEMSAENESKLFNVVEIGEPELQSLIDLTLKVAASQADWKKLDVQSSEIKEIVKRKLTAKKFIRFRTSSMSSIVTDAEALQYYENNRLKFGNLPYDGFKENIKSFLSQQILEERLRSWFDVLKKKNKARSFNLGSE